MAEAYDAAIRRRLGLINDMGSSATSAMQQHVARRPGMIGGGGGAPPPDAGLGSYSGAGGHRYAGPRGNEQALINFGKYLQGQGFRISEHPYFNGGRRVTGGHSKGSRHYSNRAIDVNFAPGTSRREQQAIDRIVGLAQLYGLRSIWRKPDHFNHAHFDF